MSECPHALKAQGSLPAESKQSLAKSRVFTHRGCLPPGLMLVSGSLAEELYNSLLFCLQVLKSEVLFSSLQGLPHSVRLSKNFLHFTVFFFLYHKKLSSLCTLVDVFPSVDALLLERPVSFLLSLQTRSQCQSPRSTCVTKKECYSYKQ